MRMFVFRACSKIRPPGQVPGSQQIAHAGRRLGHGSSLLSAQPCSATGGRRTRVCSVKLAQTWAVGANLEASLPWPLRGLGLGFWIIRGLLPGRRSEPPGRWACVLRLVPVPGWAALPGTEKALHFGRWSLGWVRGTLPKWGQTVN